jgi:hypothetical protein
MRRRTFFTSVFSNLLLLALPRWARLQIAGLARSNKVELSDIAHVVLPGSLGPARIQTTVTRFQQWIQDYPAGADAGSGYGFPHPRLLGPDPSVHYTGQLKQIGDAASRKGVSFTALDIAGKRAILQGVLTTAGVTAVPTHPTGQHVVTDLLSFFYGSSFGEDFCDNASMDRENCRELATPGQSLSKLS